MRKNLLERLEALEAVRPKHHIICTIDGKEAPIPLIKAIKTGARFVHTVDGSTDFVELYKAILNETFTDEELSELEAKP